MSNYLHGTSIAVIGKDAQFVDISCASTRINTLDRYDIETESFLLKGVDILCPGSRIEAFQQIAPTIIANARAQEAAFAGSDFASLPPLLNVGMDESVPYKTSNPDQKILRAATTRGPFSLENIKLRQDFAWALKSSLYLRGQYVTPENTDPNYRFQFFMSDMEDAQNSFLKDVFANHAKGASREETITNLIMVARFWSFELAERYINADPHWIIVDPPTLDYADNPDAQKEYPLFHFTDFDIAVYEALIESFVERLNVLRTQRNQDPWLHSVNFKSSSQPASPPFVDVTISALWDQIKIMRGEITAKELGFEHILRPRNSLWQALEELYPSVD